VRNWEKTLRRVFADPVRSDITWRDVESLLVALGAKLTQGRGSRIRVELNERGANIHRPHPRKEVKAWMIRRLRGFLIEAGIQPPD
jgi:HicA toxin of bacterial toxin-antitoxin,